MHVLSAVGTGSLDAIESIRVARMPMAGAI